MTPTQLRAFAAVVRHGSVRRAATELGVSEAAVSAHVGALRKELGDKLFTVTGGGLAFSPGGLRLASRAAELLGLQDRTVLEVSQAGAGRRLLRVAASSLFTEHAAPGLLELFAARANDLDVELAAHNPRDFNDLLLTRAVDVAIGPRPPGLDEALAWKPFLQYTVAVVASPDHPAVQSTLSTGQLREQTWLLGPSAAAQIGAVPALLRRLQVPEERQRIFQSHVAAVEEAKRGKGVAVAVAFAIAPDLADGSLRQVPRPGGPAEGVWGMITLESRDASPTAAELARFATTPRATQAMLRGAGVTIGRFRPSVHVTLWS